eukprot:56424_1
MKNFPIMVSIIFVILFLVTKIFGAAVCMEESTKDIFAVRGECPQDSKPYYSAQLVIFDAWWEWSGIQCFPKNNGCPANKTMTMKQLHDMSQSDFRIFRFFPCLKNDNMLMWKNNRTYWWSLFDEFMSFIHTISPSIYVIPKLSNAEWQNITEPKETLNEYITNSSSMSRQLYYEFLKEIITKYKNDTAILFWEIESTLNWNCDVPNGPENSYTTPQFVQFLSEVTAFIRNIDDSRPISSGNTFPKPNAWHLYFQPNNISHYDTEEQFGYMLSWQNQPVDIITAEDYGRVNYFNESAFTVRAYYIANEIAVNESKMFYLTEFGAPWTNGQFPNYSNVTGCQFVYDTLNAQIDIKDSWMLSTIFAWEDYTKGNDLLYPGRNTSVPIINAMLKANQEMNAT